MGVGGEREGGRERKREKGGGVRDSGGLISISGLFNTKVLYLHKVECLKRKTVMSFEIDF